MLSNLAAGPGGSSPWRHDRSVLMIGVSAPRVVRALVVVLCEGVVVMSMKLLSVQIIFLYSALSGFLLFLLGSGTFTE